MKTNKLIRLLVLLSIWVILLFALKARAEAPMRPYQPPPTTEETIVSTFGERGTIMLAVAKAESKLNPTDKNYNCEYEKDGRKVSRTCDRGDEIRAWSVDCGILQINVRGRECPADLFDPQKNISAAKKIYDDQGIEAWVVYKTGRYREFL